MVTEVLVGTEEQPGCYLVVEMIDTPRIVERFTDKKTAKRVNKSLGGRRKGYRVIEDHLWPEQDPDFPQEIPCVRCGMLDPRPLLEALG